MVAEEYGALVVLRAAHDTTISQTDIDELSDRFGAEPGITTVVTGTAGPDGAPADTFWQRLSEVFDTLRETGSHTVRLVLSGAGEELPERPSVARRVADAWELEVIAPDGEVEIVPGGSLFVRPDRPRTRGWWSFSPGVRPVALGTRQPAPPWQDGIEQVPERTGSGCVIHQVPAGLLAHAPHANEPEPGDLCYSVPVDPRGPTVLVGVPGSGDVSASDVGEVLSALPAALRPGIRLAPGSPRDILRTGQSAADLLEREIVVYTGMPLLTPAERGTTRAVLVGADGSPLWRPFVDAVVCAPAREGEPAPAPRLLGWNPPLPGGDDLAHGTVPLSDRWRVTGTRAGLWITDADATDDEETDADEAVPAPVTREVNAEGPAIEVGRPGDELAPSLWPELSRLLSSLGDDVRGRARLYVHGRAADGGHALRALAAQHGVRALRFTPRPEREPRPVPDAAPASRPAADPGPGVAPAPGAHPAASAAPSAPLTSAAPLAHRRPASPTARTEASASVSADGLDGLDGRSAESGPPVGGPSAVSGPQASDQQGTAARPTPGRPSVTGPARRSPSVPGPTVPERPTSSGSPAAGQQPGAAAPDPAEGSAEDPARPVSERPASASGRPASASERPGSVGQRPASSGASPGTPTRESAPSTRGDAAPTGPNPVAGPAPVTGPAPVRPPMTSVSSGPQDPNALRSAPPEETSAGPGNDTARPDTERGTVPDAVPDAGRDARPDVPSSAGRNTTPGTAPVPAPDAAERGSARDRAPQSPREPSAPPRNAVPDTGAEREPAPGATPAPARTSGPAPAGPQPEGPADAGAGNTEDPVPPPRAMPTASAVPTASATPLVSGTPDASAEPASDARLAAPADPTAQGDDGERRAPRRAPVRLGPLLPAPFRPGHVSTQEERDAFRALADRVWDRHGTAVGRLLTRMPALRGREQEDARADLIALHLYLHTSEGPLSPKALTRGLHDGEERLLPYAACVASGLRRMPSYRGIAFRGAEETAGPGGVVEPGVLLRDPAPVPVLPLGAGAPRPGGAQYAVWSVTGRRVRQLTDRPGAGQARDEVVFPPGTLLRVLDVREEGGAPLTLLREVPLIGPHTSAGSDGAEPDAGDRAALGQLEEALRARPVTPAGPDWPQLCAGSLERAAGLPSDS
ncbi:hypothetical protein DTL70_17180 [Streptomyces diacarni]|uniref:Uncharacterized protein n=1 Tax=Streptomyces diacarni TaxID=2800381 RepID=A0A367EUY1_9ACTN|nr:hypothetical protein [Streptomyces diacarni]RCG21207.1 hypothetical protein DTL70_17180 [Streptomyces diacarni]